MISLYNMCQPQKYTYEEWADTVVSGWGTQISGDPSSASNTLKYAKVPPVSDATCTNSYGGSIKSDQMICAGETIIRHNVLLLTMFPLTQVWLLAARTHVRATVGAPWSPRPLV